jgi:hypothetical protein
MAYENEEKRNRPQSVEALNPFGCALLMDHVGCLPADGVGQRALLIQTFAREKQATSQTAIQWHKNYSPTVAHNGDAIIRRN